MIETTSEVETADGPMGIHVVRPAGDAPLPAIVSFHHGPGLDDGSKEAMRRVAAWGYVVVSHDRYHRDGAWLILRLRSDAEEERHRAFTTFLAADEDRVAVDVTAVLGVLDDRPDVAPGPVGCIGYCIGGRSVLRTLADHPDRVRAGVALHPSLCTTDQPDSPHLLVAGLTAALYVGFGADDTSQSPADNQPLIAAVGDLPTGEVEVHPGAVHGFSVPGPAYHPEAADRCCSRAEALFATALR